MKVKFFQPQPKNISGTEQGNQYKNCTDTLGNQSAESNTSYCHMQAHDKYYVQENIQETADDQKIQGPSGISGGPENTRTNIIDKDKKDAGELNAQIQGRIGHQILGSLHQLQKKRGK